MDSIDIYSNSYLILSKKIPSKIISWMTILISLFIFFIIISFIPFKTYKTYSGIVIIDSNNSYINLLVDKSDFPINKNNKLYIENNLYNYNIIDIKKKSIIIKLNLNKKYKINDNLITINIFKEETTIFNMFINKLKKGFGI